MKIVTISTHFPFFNGGIDIFINKLNTVFKKNNYTVDYCNFVKNSTNLQLINEDINYTSIKDVPLNIYQFLLSKNPDLVIVCLTNCQMVYNIGKICTSLNIKAIFSLHLPIDNYNNNQKKILRNALQYYSTIHILDDKMLKYKKNLRIYTIPNPLDKISSTEHKDRNNKQILSIARKIKVKQALTTLKVYYKLSQKYPSWNFILITVGYSEQQYEEQFNLFWQKIRPNAPNIFLIDKFMTQDQITKIYKNSSIYVSSSLEGYSLSLNKAIENNLFIIYNKKEKIGSLVVKKLKAGYSINTRSYTRKLIHVIENNLYNPSYASHSSLIGLSEWEESIENMIHGTSNLDHFSYKQENK